VAASVVPTREAGPGATTRTIKIGVVGAGYWGPNLVRNFAALPNAELSMICDLDPTRLHTIGEQYPDVALTTSYADLLESDVDAIAVATPVQTHYRLVQQALLAGKHVLVEKPLTANVPEAAELVALAEERGDVVALPAILSKAERRAGGTVQPEL
jgi:predicted dehydrogenase